MLTLEWRQLDLAAGTVRLEPGSTKNRDGRIVYLTPDLKAALTAQLERVRDLERELGRALPYVFPHLDGLHQGERVSDFRRAWRTACVEAGFFREVTVQRKKGTKTVKVATMLRHDFRRTAARNLVNAGVPERVAMSIIGHKTRSVFDRYHIVSPGDLQAAAAKLAAQGSTS